MYTWTSKYTKEGATFDSGLAAYTDKNSLYPAELRDNLTRFLQGAIDAGVLTGMPTYIWDQATHTLSVVRHTPDPDAMLDYVITHPEWDDAAFVKYSTAAGWTPGGISEFKPE